MSVLVIAELADEENVAPSTYNCLAAATHLGPEVTVAVLSVAGGGAAKTLSLAEGVRKVIQVDNAAFLGELAENLAPAAAELVEQEGASHLLAPASTFGKNFLPRAAALLDCQMISDITAIIDEATFERPIYAGNAIAKVLSKDKVKVLTVRPTAFEPLASDGHSAPIEKLSLGQASPLVRFVGQEHSSSERPDLTQAGIVISGGRGMQSGENFAMLERIADKLGAAVGASRAAVDAGYVPNDYQVGQTGKVVAPELYIAVGISGAIQHLAGMKDSKVIVAINKDDEAPIFQVADYGLVADLFDVLPELEAAL